MGNLPKFSLKKKKKKTVNDLLVGDRTMSRAYDWNFSLPYTIRRWLVIPFVFLPFPICFLFPHLYKETPFWFLRNQKAILIFELLVASSNKQWLPSTSLVLQIHLSLTCSKLLLFSSFSFLMIVIWNFYHLYNSLIDCLS